VQEIAALFDRTPAQVLAVEAEEVESEQHCLVGAALLDELEARHSLP